MAPNIDKNDVPMETQEPDVADVAVKRSKAKPMPREYKIVWPVFINFIVWHIAAAYGVYLSCTSAKWATLLFNVVVYMALMIGVTAGTHRLWSHRSFKAKLPLQIILMLFQTMAWQKTVFNWVRDHRLHHKYGDTDADPYNPKRGFFYAHVGWLLTKKHPDVLMKSKTMDMSDVLNTPVLQFQKKYYYILSPILVFILPVLIPVYFWQETLNNAHHVALFRLLVSAHMVWAINSVAHIIGNRPYDKNITPTQSTWLSVFLLGEGFHNYHHTFPFDYRVAEHGNRYFNWTTYFIDFFAWIGWAYDFKHVTDDMVEKRMKRTGDGTDLWGEDKKFSGDDGADSVPVINYIWGWGDTDMTDEYKKGVGKSA